MKWEGCAGKCYTKELNPWTGIYLSIPEIPEKRDAECFRQLFNIGDIGQRTFYLILVGTKQGNFKYQTQDN